MELGRHKGSVSEGSVFRRTWRRADWYLLLFFTSFVIGLCTVSMLYYQSQQRKIKQDKWQTLTSVAELKVMQLVTWRKERLNDANLLFYNPAVSRQIDALRRQPKSAGLQAEILAWMTSFYRNREYSAACLLDSGGRILLSLPEDFDGVGPSVRSILHEAVAAKRAMFSDFQEDPYENVYLDVVVPILAEDEPTTPCIGAVLLRIDPYDYLFPMIQSWPVPSPTAENLLVRYEGDDVVYLNPLRHKRNIPLKFRMPINPGYMAAAMVARNEEGILEGIDYRNVKVLAVSHQVPNSPWIFIAKIDDDEVQEPIRTLAWFTGSMVALLVIATGLGIGLLWQNHTGSLERERYRSELERRALETHFDYLARYANDIILLIDERAHIVEANDRALAAYGYDRQELVGMEIGLIRSDEALESAEDMMDRLRLEGGLVFDTVHRRKDGSLFPVEESMRQITVDGKQFFQSIIRDVTERRQAESALRESEELFRLISESAADLIAVLDLEGRRLYNSPSYGRLLGDPSHPQGTDSFAEIHPDDRERIREVFRKTVDTGVGEPAEFRFLLPDGSIRYIESLGSVIQDDEGKASKVVVVSRDITERMVAERQLRLLAQTIASTRDCITVTDLEDNILFANDAFLRTYGYREEEILGQKASVVRSPSLPAEAATRILPATLEGGWHGEILNRKKNGSEFPVELWTSPVRDYSGKIVAMVGVARDITERKRIEESERKLLRAVEQTNEVILMTSSDGRITYVNPAFEKVYGYSQLEILGKKPSVLKSGKMTGEFYASFWQDLKAGKSVRTELINRTKGGRLVTIETSVSPIIDEQGGVSGFIAVQNDITEQRNTEDQKKALEHQLVHVQKMESIGTLAGGIAHDFNNILAIISGYASVIEGLIREPARFSQGVDAIRCAADRGASLVRQILTFARKTEVLFEPISANDIITELGKMIQQTFPKNIKLELHLDQTIHHVNGDRTQLHQALLNFCVNARDAMPDGGTLTISTSMMSGVDLRGRFLEAKREQYVCISASDSGVGMDEETKSRIFEPFFTTKEKGKGTGLGLAVVYGIVRSHYGHVDFTSTLGEGTAFTLYLPASSLQESPLSVSEEIRAEIQGGAETILLVEDEDSLRELVASLLREQGYSVLQAADGEEAVQVYAEHADHIALVFTDLGLPKLSGWQAFRKMRGIRPSVKAIVATGYLEPMLKSEIAESGVMEFLQKPYRPGEIFRKVREAIDKNS